MENEKMAVKRSLSKGFDNAVSQCLSLKPESPLPSSGFFTLMDTGDEYAIMCPTVVRSTLLLIYDIMAGSPTTGPGSWDEASYEAATYVYKREPISREFRVSKDISRGTLSYIESAPIAYVRKSDGNVRVVHGPYIGELLQGASNKGCVVIPIDVDTLEGLEAWLNGIIEERKSFLRSEGKL